MRIGFHSHFSYYSAQNTATIFEYMKKLIHWMFEDNLFINYGIIYDTTYGCSKQYRCSNIMWLISVLECTYKVIIYIFNNYPGHGGIKIDDIIGSYK